MTPTCVFDSYWRFAAERQAMYLRRLAGEQPPWTTDPILRKYRFTNVYRAADRVSQYLIGEVQYRDDRSQAPAEVFFRSILFKLFNKISTWELLERELGAITWQSADFNALGEVLDSASKRGETIYSAAYIMPPPQLGYVKKHTNHLALLRMMMDDSLPAKIQKARSLRDVYALLRPYPGLGPFLAFQFSIDLNYSTLLGFGEADFVIAGPGALDGISKCFENTEVRPAEEVIFEMVAIQAREFAQRGLAFEGLFGRPLQPIDCQNLFCEISKYARAAHPEVQGVANRSRIKQSYKPEFAPLPHPRFPPRWELEPPEPTVSRHREFEQLRLWA